MKRAPDNRTTKLVLGENKAEDRSLAKLPTDATVNPGAGWNLAKPPFGKTLSPPRFTQFTSLQILNNKFC